MFISRGQSDKIDDTTPADIPGDNRCAVQGAGAQIETEIRLLLFWSMALVAMLTKDRFHVAGEVGGVHRNAAGDQYEEEAFHLRQSVC